MVLSLLLVAAMISLFVAYKQSYSQNQRIAEIQSNARIALQTLSRDLEMAGFFGGITDLSGQTINSKLRDYVTGSDCHSNKSAGEGWLIQLSRLGFADNGMTSDQKQIESVYPCLQKRITGKLGTSVASDVLTVRQASKLYAIQDSKDDPTALQPSTFYLRTGRTKAKMIYVNSSGDIMPDPNKNKSAPQPPLWYWHYSSHLYFIGKYTDCHKSDNEQNREIPTLCRAVLSADGSVNIESIAQGVEMMQIAFGIDTDNDGVANRYQRDPTKTQLTRAVTARISLLVRSLKPDQGYTNNKTYNITPEESANSYKPEDHHYRRIFRTTVILRNAS